MFVQKGVLGYLSVWISLLGDYSSFDCCVVLNKLLCILLALFSPIQNLSVKISSKLHANESILREVFLHWYFSGILMILNLKVLHQLICWTDIFLGIREFKKFCNTREIPQMIVLLKEKDNFLEIPAKYMIFLSLRKIQYRKNKHSSCFYFKQTFRSRILKMPGCFGI